MRASFNSVNKLPLPLCWCPSWEAGELNSLTLSVCQAGHRQPVRALVLWNAVFSARGWRLWDALGHITGKSEENLVFELKYFTATLNDKVMVGCCISSTESFKLFLQFKQLPLLCSFWVCAIFFSFGKAYGSTFAMASVFIWRYSFIQVNCVGFGRGHHSAVITQHSSLKHKSAKMYPNPKSNNEIHLLCYLLEAAIFQYSRFKVWHYFSASLAEVSLAVLTQVELQLKNGILKCFLFLFLCSWISRLAPKAPRGCMKRDVWIHPALIENNFLLARELTWSPNDRFTHFRDLWCTLIMQARHRSA